MRRVLPMLLASVAAPAAASDLYPVNIERETVAAWLSEHTAVHPASVVSMTPTLVVAIVRQTTSPTPGAPMRIVLHEEVIAGSFTEVVGGRSSLVNMQLHCGERRLRMDERRLYDGPNLTGEVRTSPPSTEWVRIPETSIMDDVARAACEPGYHWPLKDFAPAPPEPPEVLTVAVKLETPVKTAEPERTFAIPLGQYRPESETPAGRLAIQIGAYQTEALAGEAWRSFSAARPIIVEGLGFETRPVTTTDGRRLWRGLIVGFQSASSQAAFCEAVAGGDIGCIPRTLEN